MIIKIISRIIHLANINRILIHNKVIGNCNRTYNTEKLSALGFASRAASYMTVRCTHTPNLYCYSPQTSTNVGDITMTSGVGTRMGGGS